MITYFQAIFLGFLQGITELFPISSLGHSVLLSWLFNWHGLLADETKSESFFLSFLVVLHVATALSLVYFYRETWVRIIKGLFGSIKQRKIENSDARLGWLLVAATIPAGIFGLVFEHLLRTQFAKPLAAIIFLMINGIILLIGDHQIMSRKHTRRRQTGGSTASEVSNKVTFKKAGIIGVFQIGALFAGISRSGITMVSGVFSGLSTEDAARFSFLLATPVILGAGVIKLPGFFSNMDAGARGQIIAGGIAAAIAAYIAVRFLDKYFQTKRLRPFGIYCLLAGVVLLIVGGFRGGF